MHSAGVVVVVVVVVQVGIVVPVGIVAWVHIVEDTAVVLGLSASWAFFLSLPSWVVVVAGTEPSIVAA